MYHFIFFYKFALCNGGNITALDTALLLSCQEEKDVLTRAFSLCDLSSVTVHVKLAIFCLLVFCSRLESLWHDELKRRGREGASLTRVFWRFCQTRMLVAIFSLLLTMVAGFVGPVSPVPILLSVSLIGLIWLSALWLVSLYIEKISSSSFTLFWIIEGKHTRRLRSLRL